MPPPSLSDSDAYGYFRLGLATGLVERSAPIAWADRQIMSDRPPTSEILELSLSAHLPYSQLIRLLTLCHPSLDYDLPLFMLLAPRRPAAGERAALRRRAGLQPELAAGEVHPAGSAEGHP